MSKIITDKEFKSIAQQKNKYVDVIGVYKGMKNKIECRCKICDSIYNVTAWDVKNGKIHNPCSHILSRGKVKKTHEEFINEMSTISNNIEIIGKYKTAKDKIECRCVLHDIYFEMDPDHLLRGQNGCQKCKAILLHNTLSKSHSDFVNELKIINQNIDVLGEYISSHEKIKVKCKVCNFVWEPMASSLISGYGCPHCVGRYKTQDEFLSQVRAINPYINVIGMYTGAKNKVKCQCLLCNSFWWVQPSNILNGSGCPICNMSHGERKIKEFLDTHNIEYVSQMKFVGLYGVGNGLLSYDFFLPQRNMLIEYQGEFHDGTAYQQTEEEFEIRKIHDERKRAYAICHDYQLVEIWYWDYKNIDDILERELC